MKQLAKNFSRTFSLAKSTQESLYDHLRTTFQRYLKEQRDNQKLPSELGYSCVLTSNDQTREDVENHYHNGIDTASMQDDLIQQYYNEPLGETETRNLWTDLNYE